MWSEKKLEKWLYFLPNTLRHKTPDNGPILNTQGNIPQKISNLQFPKHKTDLIVAPSWHKHIIEHIHIIPTLKIHILFQTILRHFLPKTDIIINNIYLLYWRMNVIVVECVNIGMLLVKFG